MTPTSLSEQYLIGDNMISGKRTIFLSLIVMALWGSLYPCIKLSYSAFSIDPGSTPDILLFAALRFLVCGGIVSCICMCRRKHLAKPSGKDAGFFLLIGLFSIVLHYGCMYVGLSMTGSGKTALIKQAGSLLYICLAFLFIREEKFSYCRIFGGLIGFLGVGAINLSSGEFQFGTVTINDSTQCCGLGGSAIKYEKEIADSFVKKLERLYPDIEYVNRLMTHSWGQRVVRFYDPDGNLIEVGTPV